MGRKFGARKVADRHHQPKTACISSASEIENAAPQKRGSVSATASSPIVGLNGCSPRIAAMEKPLKFVWIALLDAQPRE
jgi:hypothetical protein